MKGYSRFIRLINVTVDLFLLNACFFIAYYIRFPEKSFIDHKNYHIHFIAFNLFWLISTYVLKTYRVYRVTKIVNTIDIVTRNILLHILMSATLSVVLKLTDVSRFHYLVTYSSFYVSIILWKIAFTQILRKYRRMGKNFRKIILIGDGELSDEFKSIITEHQEYGYQLIKTISKSKEQSNEEFLTNVEKAATGNQIDELYCSLPDTPPDLVRKLIKLCDKNLIRIKFLPDFRGLLHKTIEIDFYDQMPILVFRNEPLNDQLNKVIKRAFDIVFSSLVIILLLTWLIPLIAILVKLSSPGPIFFKQKRSGENNNTFWCWKFRSMRINKQSDSTQASKNDERITPIGSFLRRSNLDELPQFFNVLIGNMSVVGPRPHMLSHTEEYSELIDKYMVRHFVKPGITGLAQIKGYRGETKDPRQMENRIKIDIFYIENWSLILDIKIIFLTVKNMLKGDKNAY